MITIQIQLKIKKTVCQRCHLPFCIFLKKNRGLWPLCSGSTFCIYALELGSELVIYYYLFGNHLSQKLVLFLLLLAKILHKLCIL